MADYRVFFLDAADRIISSRVIECASDAEALDVARTYLDGQPALEVWQLARRVGLITAAPVSGQPPKVTLFP